MFQERGKNQIENAEKGEVFITRGNRASNQESILIGI